jgi:hypothetical protein
VLKLIAYAICIIITVIVFGFQSGVITYTNPNKVEYVKHKYWSIDD